jgi:hypothetical protein
VAREFDAMAVDENTELAEDSVVAKEMAMGGDDAVAVWLDPSIVAVVLVLLWSCPRMYISEMSKIGSGKWSSSGDWWTGTGIPASEFPLGTG